MASEEESSVSGYHDLKVEVFYAENISSELRSLLDEKANVYVEKYTDDLVAAEAVPIMAIEKEGEMQTLLGNDINMENIEDFLD